MAKTRQIPLGNYGNGSRDFGPWTFPNGLDGFRITIGRCTTATPNIWPNASTRIKFEVWFSFDGGLTYDHKEEWTPQGGGIVSKGGIELTEEGVSWKFSPDEPTHAKATVTITGGPIRNYCDVVVS
jgi:hypothetical protein